MKREYDIGDKVIIKNTNHLYPTYKQWVQKYAPEYLPYWEYDRSFSVFSCPVWKIVFTVVAKHTHEEGWLLSRKDSNMLYLIQAPDEKVFLVGEDGITEKLKEEIFISSRVLILNEKDIYTEYDAWVKKYAPTFHSAWKSSAYNVSNRDLKNDKFEVVIKAPKALIYPFNKEDLFLVVNIDRPDEVFLVGQDAITKLN